jgi:hypothetical protein
MILRQGHPVRPEQKPGFDMNGPAFREAYRSALITTIIGKSGVGFAERCNCGLWPKKSPQVAAR